MNRYRITIWVTQIALLAATALLAVAVSAAQPSKAALPNIVILFADDLGYGDLGSYGHPYNRTPHLDQLALEGQRWTDFYAPAPVCSPSRGALLTGRLPNRTGLYGRRLAVLFPEDVEGIPAQERTMAEALKEAGYATGIVGKWHLGDAPDKLPTRHGFDYWYGIPYSNDMDWANEPSFNEMVTMRMQGRADELQALQAGHMAKYFAPKNEYWDVPLIRSQRQGNQVKDIVLARPPQQSELTKTYTEEAVAFIERSKDTPFLLYVPYSMPHTPIFRSQAFAGKSRGGRYGDVIEELDWSVGTIVAKLKSLQLAENTLVVFTSDNGPWLYMQSHGGSAGLLNNGKGTTFEGGMRVPGIFWWPGRIQPKVVSGIGSVMDLFATALSLAGVDASTGVDAHDLTHVLTSDAVSPRENLAYYRSGELRAYRKGQYKLSFVSEGAYNMPPTRIEHKNPVLYDLSADPAERFNVAASHPQIVADIVSEVERHKAALLQKPPLFDKRLAQLGNR